jgi:hypothetical protein
MKKIILLILLFTILANCDVKPRTVEAQNRNASVDVKYLFYNGNGSFPQYYQYHEEIHNDMTYGIWSKANGNHQTGFAISVVNITKETLEVELLKLQIAETHQRLEYQKNKNIELN